MTILPDEMISGSQIHVTRDPLRKVRYYLWASWRTAIGGLRAWFIARHVDVIFIQKVVFPAPVRWLFKVSRPIVVYDFDDAIFTTEQQIGGNWLVALKARRNARGVPAMLGLAGSRHRGERIHGRFCQEILSDNDDYRASRYDILSTTAAAGRAGEWGFDCDGLDRQCDHAPVTWNSSAVLSVGSAGGFPDLRLEIVGAEAPAMNGLSVQSRPWDLEREGEDLNGFDIGLMPIADDAWTRGKGGYKLLQYMASGLPVVTSPVGVNREIVTDGESGFWARDELEWEEKLARLVQDRDLREEMGRRGRETVEARYALSLHQERLLETLRSLVSAGKAS